MKKAARIDIGRIANMAARFHTKAQEPWPWDYKAFCNAIAAMIETGHVTVSPGGFMVGLKQPHPLNPAWIVAHELLWWAEDGTGAAHFKAFREWAADAHEIKWSCRAGDERTARFYGRFAAPESIYFSEVNPCASAQF